MASRTRVFLFAAFVLAAFTPLSLAQIITEFPLASPGSNPDDITAGPDGNLWFTEFTKIGRITTAASITEFAVPGPGGAGDIAAGPDGNLWFTQGDFDGHLAHIGRISPTGSLTRFPLPDTLRGPGGITAGPDGNLWFTRVTAAGNQLGRMTTAGALTEFPIPAPNPGGMTTGPDGRLWLTEITGNKILRITTDGVVSEFSIPTAASEPIGITAGADGNLWFTEYRGNKIGRITTAGGITEFPIPTSASGPWGIAAGPDGALWFTERSGNQVGRITTAGVFNEFPTPTASSEPIGITAGPDDAIWFTEWSGHKIGRITTGVVADPIQILPVVGSTVGVGGSFFRTSVQLHNSGTTPSGGRILFHPSGIRGSDADPGLEFTLAPGQTRTIADLLPAMERSGLGSADVLLTLGSAGNVPIASARVFNDAGAAGTTGFAFNALTPDDALHAGRRGVLTVPADLTNFRMNVGVRTLDAAVSMTLTVRDAAGAIAASIPKFFPATYHEQQTATAFLSGLPLPPGGSITALVEAGSAIVYGATVDNRTGDPSLQIAAPAP